MANFIPSYKGLKIDLQTASKDELLKDSSYESRIINLNKDLSEKSVIINEQQLQINSKKKSLLRWRIFGVSVSLIALLYVCTKS